MHQEESRFPQAHPGHRSVEFGSGFKENRETLCLPLCEKTNRPVRVFEACGLGHEEWRGEGVLSPWEGQKRTT